MASMPHQPDCVQGLLDFVDQGIRGVKEPGDADHPQHTDLEVVDKADDSGGDLEALGTQRLKGLSQQWFDLMVDVEGL
jgi:hypothetical protein